MSIFTKSVHTEGYNSINQEHNNRTKTTNMEHVDPDGKILILKNQGLRDAYEEVFGDAQKEYNDKQKRAARKIDSYFDKIINEYKIGIKNNQENVRQPAYETIVQIGNRDSAPTDEKCEAILTEYSKWFSSLENVHTYGAYIHFDEQGAPHLHQDYFFYSDGFKNSLKRQNGLEKALNSMGFYTKGKKDTAIEQFTKFCRNKLTEIAKSHGIELQEDKECHREHLKTEDYKLKQAVEHEIENLNVLQKENKNLQHKNDKLSKSLQKGKISMPREEFEGLQHELTQTRKELKQTRQKYYDADDKLILAAKEIERLDAVSEAAFRREEKLQSEVHKLQHNQNILLTKLQEHEPDFVNQIRERQNRPNRDHGISR